MTRKEKSVIWIQVECNDSLAVLKCLACGHVERVPSQWICSPGAWRNPSFTVVSLNQKVIGLAPREVKSREIHKSQCEKLSLLGEWEGDHSCRCFQRACPGCGVEEAGCQTGLAAENQLDARVERADLPACGLIRSCKASYDHVLCKKQALFKLMAKLTWLYQP